MPFYLYIDVLLNLGLPDLGLNNIQWGIHLNNTQTKCSVSPCYLNSNLYSDSNMTLYIMNILYHCEKVKQK